MWLVVDVRFTPIFSINEEPFREGHHVSLCLHPQSPSQAGHPFLAQRLPGVSSFLPLISPLASFMLSQGALEILSYIPWRPKELTTLRIPNVYLFHTKQVKPQSVLTLLARVRKPLTLEMSGKEHTVPPGMYAPELQGTHVKLSCKIPSPCSSLVLWQASKWNDRFLLQKHEANK